MSAYRDVPLGEVLEPVERPVEVQPGQDYPAVGVRSFGAGCFDAGVLSGAETRYGRLLRVEADDFVYPKLMAWEGAFAIVPEPLANRHVSPEFCVFRARPGVDIRWLGFLFKLPQTWEEIAGSSIGTNVRRRRLYPRDFLTRVIALPDLDEQRRVAAKLDDVLGGVATAAEKLTRLEKLSEAAADAAIQTILDRGTNDGWPLRGIEEVAEVNPAPSAVDPMATVTFVPMAAVDEVTGTIASPVDRFASEVSRGYKQFKRGDVIFARITPCMQNGKSAVANGIKTQYGYGSTEFHVLRPADTVLPDWIHRIVRTRSFRAAAAERFTGTAGQQRVPADFLRAARIPVPRSVGEQRGALARIDRVVASYRKAQILQSGQRARLVALEPSILNRAFAGEL